MKESRTAESLLAYEASDPLQQQVIGEVLEMLEKTGQPPGDMDVRIYLIDFDKAPQLKDSEYYTDIMKTFLAESSIIINAAFLAELEAALRAFNLSGNILSSPYFRSDESLFILVQEYEEAPEAVLNRFREMNRIDPVKNAGEEDSAADQLKMAVFFLLSHEVGHLLKHHHLREFGNLSSTSGIGKEDVPRAVVKMCSHADDFKNFGFDLPGFKEVENPTGAARLKEEAFKQLYETEFSNNKIWLADENEADKTAIAILKKYFSQLQGKSQKNKAIYHFTKAMFTAGIYFWYKDLIAFSKAMDMGWLPDSTGLYIQMMEKKENYVYAAGLFGKIHRFILLRSFFAIQELLERETDLFGENKKQIFYSSSILPLSDDEWQSWHLAECMRMNLLLRLVMDTPVKLAYIGCSAGWMLEMDKKRGTPQLFAVSFESVRQAVDRILQGKFPGMGS